MPFDFLSWRHYLNTLFRHFGVALTILIVILPVAEPIRDWGPKFLSSQNWFLENWILSNLSEFLKKIMSNGDLKHSAWR